MAAKRRRLAERRKSLGYSQESFAEDLGVDRSTVGRWEGGETEPLAFIRPKLCRVLKVTPDELRVLLASSAVELPAPPAQVVGRVVPEPEPDAGELDEMNRRELLRLLSIAGTLVAIPQRAAADAVAEADTFGEAEQFALLNAHLWRVFALSKSKRLVYPLVRDQLGMLIDSMERTHSPAAHERLCVLACDLFQLAGEIFFDSNRYTDAAYCYTLAASAGREARAYDQWACALTRQAFINMYDHEFTQAETILTAASRVAQRGDDQLSTRYWVAAVQAQAYAGLGDLDACNRALDKADEVLSLNGPVKPGGWLRFDGSRLAEERGGCYLALGRDDLAETALTEALGKTISLRRQGSVLVDLAMLGVHRRDPDQILHHAGRAIDLATQTQSAGYVGRKLRSLQPRLTPFLKDGRVDDLNSRIDQLSRSA